MGRLVTSTSYLDGQTFGWWHATRAENQRHEWADLDYRANRSRQALLSSCAQLPEQRGEYLHGDRPVTP